MDIVLNHVNCGMCTVVFSPISNVKHDTLIVIIIILYIHETGLKNMRA